MDDLLKQSTLRWPIPGPFRAREKECVCVRVLWRLGGVAWSSEKGRNSLGWGPKGEARYELCSGAIIKILPLIRLALNNTLTDMTNRCIRACHSSLFGFLSSFHSSYSFLLDIIWLTFPPCVPLAQIQAWPLTSKQMCNLTVLPLSR